MRIMNYSDIRSLLTQAGWTESNRDEVRISYNHTDRAGSISLPINGDAPPAVLRMIERITGLTLPRF
jgi:hypothetical protein